MANHEEQRNAKIDAALSGLLDQFKTGQIADTVALATFPPISGIPSEKWSLMNRVLMIMHGTGDARGYRQWQEVGRQVTKGSKAFHILGPRMVKADKADTSGNPGMKCIGFFCIPVFCMEDTDGEPLAYEQHNLPEFPLLDVARVWGIEVKAVGFTGMYLGMFRGWGRDEILLAGPEEKVFFHELSHAAHEKVLRERGESLKGGQNWRQEIVAELSAAVLCRLAGRSDKDTAGNSFSYIQDYAARAGKDALRGIASVIADVDRVLHRIMETADVAQAA